MCMSGTDVISFMPEKHSGGSRWHWYERYLALKQELEEMGMFAQEYKQPIPRFIKRLGVVTAPTGAAVQDIRNISLRRNPYLQIILYPALVQGAGAAESIVKGIRMLDAAGVDVIIVGRGGGSIEDLWAFNEEIVARAIFECRTPVISAVGHETDFTIADFVADLRAPTPSAAAELAVDDFRSVAESVFLYRQRFYRAMSNQLDSDRNRLKQLQMRLGYLSPQSRLREQRQRLVDLEDAVRGGMDRKMKGYRHELELYLERFGGLVTFEKAESGICLCGRSEQKNTYKCRTGKKRGYHICIRNRWNHRSTGMRHRKGGQDPWGRTETVSRHLRRKLWRRFLRSW